MTNENNIIMDKSIVKVIEEFKQSCIFDNADIHILKNKLSTLYEFNNHMNDKINDNMNELKIINDKLDLYIHLNKIKNKNFKKLENSHVKLKINYIEENKKLKDKIIQLENKFKILEDKGLI